MKWQYLSHGKDAFRSDCVTMLQCCLKLNLCPILMYADIKTDMFSFTCLPLCLPEIPGILQEQISVFCSGTHLWHSAPSELCSLPHCVFPLCVLQETHSESLQWPKGERRVWTELLKQWNTLKMSCVHNRQESVSYIKSDFLSTPYLTRYHQYWCDLLFVWGDVCMSLSVEPLFGSSMCAGGETGGGVSDSKRSQWTDQAADALPAGGEIHGKYSNPF